MRKLLIPLVLLFPALLHGATSKLPPNKELKALAFDSLSAFNKSVQKKDFTGFYNDRLSSQLREQVSLEKFSETFRVFIEKGYDISSIAQSEAVFDKTPAIDEDGVLVLQGHYPSKPNRVKFTLKYVYDSSTWKLLAINVRAVPAGENAGPVPTTKELEKLVLDSLMSFSQAVKAEDFDEFYEGISKAWQKETSPQELGRLFKTFVQQKVDIGSIAKEKPAFNGTPAVNDDGHLVVSGSYPTPNKVDFELKYLNEEGHWKLVGINVEVKPGEKSKSDSDDDDDTDDDE
jgi:hypothetical protein